MVTTTELNFMGPTATKTTYTQYNLHNLKADLAVTPVHLIKATQLVKSVRDHSG